MKKNSIHTIAKDLGISATTVSFVINGKAKEKRISEELIARAKLYIDKIGYKPNPFAQSLRTGKTNIIGMMVEDISDPFFSAIARGVEIGLEDKGYNLFYLSTKNEMNRAMAILSILKDHGADAFIIAPSLGLEQDISALISSKKPVILFDRYFPDIPTFNIVVDNKGGAFSATMELIDSGYQNIAFVTLASDQVQILLRKNGYMAGLEISEQKKPLILEVPYNMDKIDVSLLIQEFLSANNMIDAILFATNYLTIAGISILQEMGIRIGTDMGVISFDDNNHFSLFSPSITAVAQPVSEISNAIVEQTLNALQSNISLKPDTKVLPTKLIRRESTLR